MTFPVCTVQVYHFTHFCRACKSDYSVIQYNSIHRTISYTYLLMKYLSLMTIHDLSFARLSLRKHFKNFMLLNLRKPVTRLILRIPMSDSLS